MGLECSQCGWSQPEEARKCPMCGARVSPQRFGAPPPAPTAQPVARQPTEVAPKQQASKRVVLLVAMLALAAGAPIVFLLAKDDRPRPTSTLKKRARVVGTSGDTPVKPGQNCTIRIEPSEGGRYNCRVVIGCGQYVLFGTKKTNGFADCAVSEGAVTRAHEAEPNDSDPDVYFDVATARATVKETTWQVDMEVID